MKKILGSVAVLLLLVGCGSAEKEVAPKEVSKTCSGMVSGQNIEVKATAPTEDDKLESLMVVMMQEYPDETTKSTLKALPKKSLKKLVNNMIAEEYPGVKVSDYSLEDDGLKIAMEMDLTNKDLLTKIGISTEQSEELTLKVLEAGFTAQDFTCH